MDLLRRTDCSAEFAPVRMWPHDVGFTPNHRHEDRRPESVLWAIFRLVHYNKKPLIDHLVGGGAQLLRNMQTKLFARLARALAAIRAFAPLTPP
jgi:hypothetical protein